MRKARFLKSFEFRSAFSLLELVVVIAVVAILIGLAMPVLSRSWEEVASATCQTNLRTLVVGWRAVENEHPNIKIDMDLGIREALKGDMADSAVLLCPREPAVPALDSYAWPYGGLFSVQRNPDIFESPYLPLMWERHPGFHSSNVINVAFEDGHIATTTSLEWLTGLNLDND